MVCNVFWAVMETSVLLGVGVLALKLKMVEPQDISKLSRLALELFMPLLTFSVITRTFSAERLNEFWIMPLMGLAIMAAGAVAGIFLKRFIHCKTPARMATFHHICAVNNNMFLPLIVINSIFSDRHTALLLVMNVGSTVGFWTIGIVTLAGVRKDTLLKSVKNIFSVNVYAVIIAMLVAVCGIPVPKIIASVSATLGGIAVPFTIVLTGAALYNGITRINTHKLDVLYLSVVRLLIMPLILIGMLKILPLERTVYETCFVVALMPAAVTSVLVTRINGGDDLFAGQSIIATTLLSLVTIPLLMMLL